jgi:hypothetical protein
LTTDSANDEIVVILYLKLPMKVRIKVILSDDESGSKRKFVCVVDRKTRVEDFVRSIVAIYGHESSSSYWWAQLPDGFVVPLDQRICDVIDECIKIHTCQSKPVDFHTSLHGVTSLTRTDNKEGSAGSHPVEDATSSSAGDIKTVWESIVLGDKVVYTMRLKRNAGDEYLSDQYTVHKFVLFHSNQVRIPLMC